MKIRTLGWLVGLSACASSFLSCTQAQVACVVGHAGSGVAYIAQYFNPTDSPAGCGMKSQLQIQSLVWQSVYNASLNTDPPKGECTLDADDNLVLVSDDTKPCEKFCAADADCNSKHCAAVKRACAANADCYSNDCSVTKPCMTDANCDTKKMHKCVLSNPMDPMSAKICENEKFCGANEKICDAADPPSLEVLSSLSGDQIGMESYHPPMQVGDETQPDFSKGTVAILPDTVLNLSSWSAAAGLPEADPDNNKPYAIGDFASAEPDANNICPVQNIKPAVQKFPGIDPDAMPMPEQVVPAQDFTYEWKNVEIYVSAAVQGTQFTGDLTYTQVDHTALNGDPMDMPSTCSVTYRVRGLWPAVACWVPDPSEDPRFTDQPQIDPATGKLVVDDALCCAEADPANGHPVGSGISPDFPVKCDPVLGYCVLDAPADAKLPITGGNKNPACVKASK